MSATKGQTTQTPQPSPFVKKTLRTIVIGLLIDILAFTMILPLLPRLLESYHNQPEKVHLLLLLTFTLKGRVLIKPDYVTKSHGCTRHCTEAFNRFVSRWVSRFVHGWTSSYLEVRSAPCSPFCSLSRVRLLGDSVTGMDDERFCCGAW